MKRLAFSWDGGSIKASTAGCIERAPRLSRDTGQPAIGWHRRRVNGCLARKSLFFASVAYVGLYRGETLRKERIMKKLLIIALVSIVAAAAFALPPVPPVPWVGQAVTVDIDVLMDIKPVAQLTLGNTVIKLEPVDGTVNYVGEAGPDLPLLQSNVPVTVTGLIVPAAPLVAPDVDGTGGGLGWAISLQGSGDAITPANWEYPTSSADYDPAYIGAGVGVPVAVLCVSPDLTQRPQGDNQVVAVVELTVMPRPQ